MYIHSTYKEILNIEDIKQYKNKIKELSSINLRRSSKFNILAIYGALKCLENTTCSKYLSIYIASEYSCTSDMLKVLLQSNIKEEFVMPYDFLNVNTNNVGFFISKALNTFGKNINITSKNLSFEKAFELAYYDLLYDESIEALIGGVDESLNNIRHHDIEHKEYKDGTSWIHLSNNKTNAIAKIISIESFPSIKELNMYLKDISYDKLSLNLYAQKFIEELLIKKEKIIKQEDEFYGTYSAGYIINLLKKESKLLHISLDERKKAYLFFFHKISNSF